MSLSSIIIIKTLIAIATQVYCALIILILKHGSDNVINHESQAQRVPMRRSTLKNQSNNSQQERTLNKLQGHPVTPTIK